MLFYYILLWHWMDIWGHNIILAKFRSNGFCCKYQKYQTYTSNIHFSLAFWLNIYNISHWTFSTELWEEMKQLSCSRYTASLQGFTRNHHKTLISPMKWLRWKIKSYHGCRSYNQPFSVLMGKAGSEKMALMLIICIKRFNRSLVMNEQLLSAYTSLWEPNDDYNYMHPLFLSLARFKKTQTPYLSVETSAKSHHMLVA